MAIDLAKEANKVIEQSKSDVKKASVKTSKDLKTAQEQIAKQAKDTANKTVKETKEKVAETIKKQSESISQQVSNTDILAMTKQLFGNGYTGQLVDAVMEKSVENLLDEQLKKGKISLQVSKIGTTYATAEMYFKKIYDVDSTMLSLKNKAEQSISKSMNRSINDKIAAWQNGLPEWQRRLLAQSKICSSITNFVNIETKNCIDAVFSSAAISKYSSKMVGTIKDLQDRIESTIQTKYKKEFEYVQKLKKAVQDKLVYYQHVKAKYEKILKDAIDAFKKKIADALAKWTQALITSITSSIKIKF